MKVDRPHILITSLLLVSLVLNLFFIYQQRKHVEALANSILKTNQPEESDDLRWIKGNIPSLYYAFQDRVESVPASVNQSAASDLPDSLLIEPGTYRFFGNAYELRKEGLYRFVYPQHENQQRIVYKADPEAILSGLAWIFSHGLSDNDKSLPEVLLKAKTSKVFATCGEISLWSQELLESKGIKSRVVASLTLDTWNTYDNGHTLIEVYRDSFKKWVIYDLDKNVYFWRNNVPLSLNEFADQVPTGDYEIRRLASDSEFDVSNSSEPNGYDYAFVMEELLANEQSLKRWYKHAIQVPMIASENRFFFFDDVNRSRIQSYSEKFEYLDKKQFMEKFYSPGDPKS